MHRKYLLLIEVHRITFIHWIFIWPVLCSFLCFLVWKIHEWWKYIKIIPLAIVSILLEEETQGRLWHMQNNKESEQNTASKMCSFLLSHQDAHPSGTFSLWFHVWLARNTQRHLHCRLPECKQATEKQMVLLVIISNNLMSPWVPLSKRANIIVSVGVHQVCKGGGDPSFCGLFWVQSRSHICSVMVARDWCLITFGKTW